MRLTDEAASDRYVEKDFDTSSQSRGDLTRYNTFPNNLIRIKLDYLFVRVCENARDVCGYMCATCVHENLPCGVCLSGVAARTRWRPNTNAIFFRMWATYLREQRR